MNGNWTKEKFKEHHEKNPHVYDRFEKYALQVAQHRDHFSAKAIFHRMRWDTAVAEVDSDFKISDGWISHYARMFMENNPQYEGFFRTVVRKDSYHDASI